uniref:Uncharacterized protein n=1 Tax=Panagrolaimus sp. PS1159 TaxID=55785 RepID=A0AC35FLW0_9BILA
MEHYSTDKLTTLKYCTTGVFESLWPLLSSIIIFTFLQRILLSFDSYLSRKTIDFLIGTLGITFLIYRNVNYSTIAASVIYFILSAALIRIFRTYKYLGPAFILYSLAAICFCQLLFDSSLFLSFRGSIMIMAMKMISLSFDIHRTEFEDAGFFEMFGYCFNPATYFFGLFTSFEKYKKAKGFGAPKDEIRPLLFAAGYFVASCASVFYGDCLLSLLPEKHVRLNEFRDAQSFRFGHYFVQYFLWSTAILGGLGGHLQTVNALKIEFPRSMEEIVAYWNIPMHEFLHRYVYSHTRSINQPFAIGLTFLTSALMHGVNFQIAAVLISLGLFGIAENAFRRRLAHRLNLCVKSRDCVHCSHKNGNSKAATVITRCINFVFTISNIILLIYLGMPFDNDETAQIGYSMQHTLGHWKKWYFIGHLYSLFLLLTSFVF